MARARSAAGNVGKLLDGLAAPLWLIDEDRRVAYCNAAGARWLSVEPDALLGTLCNFHSLPDAAPLDRAAAQICPPGDAFQGARVRSQTLGPDDVPHAIEFIPLVGESGETSLVLAIIDSEQATTTAGQGSDAQLHAALQAFRARQARSFSVDKLIGSAPQMALARDRVQLAVESRSSVLIVGQPGTGREHLVRTIHERSGKPYGPLVALACGTLSAELLVSTLEAATRNHPPRTPPADPTGTLLLSDIDLLPPEAHREFARLLATSRTSLRVLCTCTQPLSALVASQKFPVALAYALSAIEIQLPTLGERLQDLPLLAQAFLEDINAGGGKQVSGFLPETLDLMAAYSWPGNLDELASVVAECHERAGVNVAPRDLPKAVVLAVEASARPRKADEAIDLESFLERVERELIERALARAKGNKSRAAKLLGMTRPRLYRRLVQLKLA